MKTDARVLNTKRALREALCSCMKEKPLNDITVTELCALAKVNRASFYNHYRDCRDIIDEVEREQLEDFRMLLMTRDKFGEELINDVLDQIENYRKSDMAVLAAAFTKNYIDAMANLAREYAFEDWQKRMPRASEKEVELALTVMIAATLHVVSDEAAGYDRETVVRFINNMINGCVRMYE